MSKPYRIQAYLNPDCFDALTRWAAAEGLPLSTLAASIIQQRVWAETAAGRIPGPAARGGEG